MSRRRGDTQAPWGRAQTRGQESPFLDPLAISKLESLAVRARVIVEGALSGMHRARLHGSSVEFAEHKEYSPGDEIRHIDWKVYGRADRYYVKQFEQESELCCYLALDASGSMGYGAGLSSKLEYAGHLLGAMAYLLIRQRDKVGLLVFGDEGLDRYVPPRARPAHLHDLLTVIEEVCRLGARGRESTAAALDRLGELARHKRSLMLLASDLFDPEGQALGVLRRLRARGHDVAFLHVLHPDELELPFEGLTLFEALESRHELLAEPGAVRKEYRRRLGEFLARVKNECTSGGVDYLLAPTGRPLEETLMEFLTSKTRGGRGRA